MENYEKLIEELLKADTPKGRYDYLVWLIHNQKPSEDKKIAILDRKAQFKGKVAMFKDEFSAVHLNDFYSYWTEIGEGQKKMRWEKEKTFEIKKRLERWVKNDFNKNNNGRNKQVIQSPIEHKKDFTIGFR
jgi:hypothetical protein